MYNSLPRVFVASALLSAASSPSFAASPAQDAGIRWEPYTGEAADGSALAGRLGRIAVPERHGTPDGKRIEIAFVVYKTTKEDAGPPIVYLAGGPGASGIEHCAREATDPRLRLLDHADVIGIDQRGTGLSVPNLGEPAFEYELPMDEPIGRDDVVRAFREAVARAVAFWRAEGVDLAAYNTVESADDIDAVRRALGVEKVIPWGTSYGSHLGLAYLRRHSAHVSRAVLMKVEGPDDTFKLPSTVQKCLEQWSGIVAATPELHAALPDLLGTVRRLLEKLAMEPVTLTRNADGGEVRVVIGPYDLQQLIANALGSSNGIAGLPAALAMMEQGHWDVIFRSAVRGRHGDIQSAMSVMMDCASGATPERKKRIERESADRRNVLADALDGPFYPAVCDAAPTSDLGDAFRGPLACRVPVLFVSGALDARTPPANVDAIRGGFSDHAHLVIEGTGHDARELESAEYCSRVSDFLDGKRVASGVIAMPPINFRPLAGR